MTNRIEIQLKIKEFTNRTPQNPSDIAFGKKIKIAVNPGIAQLSLPNFSQITKKIDMLIVNQEEASFLTKIPYQQEKEIFKIRPALVVSSNLQNEYDKQILMAPISAGEELTEEEIKTLERKYASIFAA